MPITQGFWARINDLLGTGKQKLVMDGEWANSLKAFVTRTLPFQKCLVKQVSLAVFLDPDILGSHCLPFYLTYTTREVPGWRWSSQRGAPCRAKLGTRKWRAPPNLLQRPGPCPWRSIYFMIHKWKGSGVDEPVCLWRVSSSFNLRSRREKRKMPVPTTGHQEGTNQREPRFKLYWRFPFRRKPLTSKPSKRNQDVVPVPPFQSLLGWGDR